MRSTLPARGVFRFFYYPKQGDCAARDACCDYSCTVETLYRYAQYREHTTGVCEERLRKERARGKSDRRRAISSNLPKSEVCLISIVCQRPRQPRGKAQAEAELGLVWAPGWVLVTDRQPEQNPLQIHSSSFIVSHSHRSRIRPTTTSHRAVSVLSSSTLSRRRHEPRDRYPPSSQTFELDDCESIDIVLPCLSRTSTRTPARWRLISAGGVRSPCRRTR